MQRSELSAINALAGVSLDTSAVFLSAELAANDKVTNAIDTARLGNALCTLKAKGVIDSYAKVYGVYAGQSEASYMVLAPRRNVGRLYELSKEYQQESILLLERLGDHGEGDLSGRLIFGSAAADQYLGIAAFTSRHDARINHSDAHTLFSASYHAQLALVMVDESELGRFEDERYVTP